MRRLWPNPDKERDPGGILTVIAEDIEVFGVRFFDGMQWQMDWAGFNEELAASLVREEPEIPEELQVKIEETFEED